MDTGTETKEERVARRGLEMTWGKHPFGEDRTKHDMMENLRMTSAVRIRRRAPRFEADLRPAFLRSGGSRGLSPPAKEKRAAGPRSAGRTAGPAGLAGCSPDMEPMGAKDKG